MPIGRHLETPKPGERIRARQLAAAAKVGEQLGRLTVGGGLNLSAIGGAPLVRQTGSVDGGDRGPRIAMTDSSGIGPRVGLTLGAGTCRIQRLKLVAGALDLVDSGKDLVIYNLAETAAEPLTYIMFKYSDGFPIVDWEACVVLS